MTLNGIPEFLLRIVSCFRYGMVCRKGLLAVLLFVGLSSTALAAEFPVQSQQKYFAGLRERELFELIELLCEQNLSRQSITPVEQEFYLLELARTYALHARQVPLAEAEELWTQAERTLERLPRQSVYRELERGLMAASRAEQMFWIAQLSPADVSLRKQFLDWAGRAITLLQPLQSGEFTSRLPEEAEAGERLDELRLAQAGVMIRRAEILRENVAERAADLQQASQLLQPLARRTVRGREELEAQLLLMSVFRLQGKQSELKSLHKDLSNVELPAAVRLRATAELARAQLEAGEYIETVELIQQEGRAIGSLSSELEGLRLQALVGMAAQVRQKKDLPLAEELETEVEVRLQRLRDMGETYQVRLVENFQQQSRRLEEFGAELAEQVEQARGLLRQGEVEQAVAAYARSLGVAAEQARTPAAMQIVQEAAAVLIEQREYARAAGLLEQVWRSAPAFEGMEQIHLQWIQALGRDYIAEPSAGRLSAYQQGLVDHRSRYVEKETQAEVLWLLAELQFARTQVTQSLELYRQIPENSPRYLQACLRMGQCYRWVIERIKTLGQPVEAWRQQAVEYARSLLRNPPLQWKESPVAAEALLEAARILQEFSTETADRQLVNKQVISLREVSQSNSKKGGDSSEGQTWRKVEYKALAMEAIVLAQAGQISAARQLLLGNERPLKPTEVLFVARQLEEVEGSSPELQVALAELQLFVIQPLIARFSAEFDGISASDRRSLLEIQARALIKVGRLTPAIRVYEQLHQSSPGDRALLEQLSRMYVECNNAECAEKLYRLWQEQVPRETQGSESWLEARYQLARAALRSGRGEEARKIVQMTRLLYPSAGTESLQKKFQDLDAELKKSGVK